jgi:hypothetical protein
MVILPIHISHVLQPVDVTYFKLFKVAFRQFSFFTLVKSNYLELEKITLATWVDKALQQSLKNENIKSRFRIFGI